MQQIDQPAILARDISKTYQLHRQGRKPLFSKTPDNSVKALNPLSFVASKGECIGVLGKNGSGKSTMMRLLSGIESPTTGEIYVRSRPTLLGVGAALQNQLSANTNIILGLLAMGLSKEEASSLRPEILQWTELSDAADRPIQTYSSGMRARLKFGISTAVPRDILLVDEALSTGDTSFTDKASERMQSFLDQAGTVMIVSHDSSTIRKFCNRVLWLHQGELLADGDVEYFTKTYLAWSRNTAANQVERANQIIETQRNRFTPKRFIRDSEASRLLNRLPSE